MLFATYLYTKPEKPTSLAASQKGGQKALDEEGKVGLFDESRPKSENGRDLQA